MSDEINWGDELDRVEEATKPMEEGRHRFNIVEAKTKTASTGNRMIVLTVKAAPGDVDAGKTAITNLVFSTDNPRAMKMTVRRLEYLGYPETRLRAENPSLELIAAALIGATAEADVTHREWNGEKQEDINFVASQGGLPASASSGPAGMPAAVSTARATTPSVAATPVATAAAPPEPEPAPQPPEIEVPLPDDGVEMPEGEEEPF